MIHPYYLAFDQVGDLYVGAQDTNVIIGIHGPNSSQAGKPMPLSIFLETNYSDGSFAAGTFIPAASAKISPKTRVPKKHGGLSGNDVHSVRGFAFLPNHTLYVADEGNDRIAVYDSETGALTNTITNKQMQKPVQIFYNTNDGLVYIASPGSSRILTYNPKTDILKTFIHDAERLSHVSGIAFGDDEHFYAADRKKKVIYQYDALGNYIKIFAGPFKDSPEGILPLYDN